MSAGMDAGVVVTTHRPVAGRREQRAVADAEMAGWERLPEGCAAMDCLLSTDGRLILFKSRWTDEHAVRPPAGETVVSRFAGAPPAPAAEGGPFAGCVALMRIGTDGPERQREAAERIAAVPADANPGAIGGHLLFSLDGTLVTLYAEWTSEEAHREAIEGAAFGGEQGIFAGRSGIRGLSMHRYQLYRRSWSDAPRWTAGPRD